MNRTKTNFLDFLEIFNIITKHKFFDRFIHIKSVYYSNYKNKNRITMQEVRNAPCFSTYPLVCNRQDNNEVRTNNV